MFELPPTRVFPKDTSEIFLAVIFTADPEVFIDTITPDRLVRCTMAAIDFNHSTFKLLRRCKREGLIHDKLLSHSKSSNTIFKKSGCVNLDLWEKDLVHLKRSWTWWSLKWKDGLSKNSKKGPVRKSLTFCDPSWCDWPLAVTTTGQISKTILGCPWYSVTM